MKESEAIKNTKLLARNILKFIECSPWRDNYSERIKVLAERADYPCELAVVGQVKAGKSSFLNALLGEDWAMVGTTETTATINFFKYGIPEDVNRPVKVVWDDGSEEWQTRKFLDSLQGNTPDILKKSERIDHLEYYLQDDKLRNITIVDTPGVNALVGAHNKRSRDYIKGESDLRNKHNIQSINLKNKADAIVVITGRVPEMSTNDLLMAFNQGTSSFNAIGVMTKIDIEDNVSLGDWQRRCSEYTKLLRDQLNTIVPVSAQVYRAVEKLEKSGKLKLMASLLTSIPKSDFEEVCKSRDTFLGNDEDINDYFSQYGLPYDLRKSLAENLDWMVFYTIAKELYTYPVEEAKKRLIEYSGMDQIKALLDQQFFNRSRIIRCSKIVKDLREILFEILNRRIYNLRRDANNRQYYLDIINTYPDEGIRNDFRNFVEENILTKEQYEKYESSLRNLINQTESLLQSFKSTDKTTEGLLLLEKKQSYFSSLELDELETLFGKYFGKQLNTEREYIASRQVYWRGKNASVRDNDVHRIIEFAIEKYGTI